MSRFLRLWQTTTVRLTAVFILIFVLAAIGLLGYIAYNASIVIQQSQMRDIERETDQLQRLDLQRGPRAVIVAVQNFANRPGPGIYYLGDDVGRMLVGNVSDFPPSVLSVEGVHSFDYDKGVPINETAAAEDDHQGRALVRSTLLPSGLRLIVGRDIVERRTFSAIIFQGFAVGLAGIVVLSAIAGGFTARRVLKRIDSISDTSALIMSGNLAERVPVTNRNDEFDRLATSLNAMLDRIEQLMQGLKEVTDNVAHDLTTPLTRLRNKAESALRDSVSNEDRQKALETTIEESDQLIRTFNALLMIARVEAGTPSGAFSSLNLSEVVDDVAELYAPVAEDQEMTLEAEIEPDIHLNANRELISQALVNLIENAIKYAHRPGKPGVINLSLKQREDHIELQVSDNGPGVPEADRKRVLERFVRLEKSRTEPGSGLGLSLVAAVIRLHKGTMRLQDNAPGLKVVIELPKSA